MAAFTIVRIADFIALGSGSGDILLRPGSATLFTSILFANRIKLANRIGQKLLNLQYVMLTL